MDLWPHNCVLCEGEVKAGTDAAKWGFWWGGTRWVHFACASDVGDAARRIEAAPKMDMTTNDLRRPPGASPDGEGGVHD